MPTRLRRPRGTAQPSRSPGVSPITPLPVLTRGAHGGHVYGVQARLRDHGFSLVVDGVFGPETEAAVMAFRYARGLARVGVVDDPTWRALLSGPTLPTLRYGSTGPYVFFLQQRLIDSGFNPGTVDGIFGSRTRSAVVAFQQARGLAADGVVGPQTWGALLRGYLG